MNDKIVINSSEYKKGMNSTAILLGLIMLLASALRFYNLNAKSYWNDEMYAIIDGQQNVYQIMTARDLSRPPAYYLPFHFWIQIFGKTETSTRSFSALAGIASVLLVYLVGRELFGIEAGLLSAFLMATSSFQIYYSQTTRFYSFFECMALLSFFFFILSIKRKKKIFFAFYTVASILLIYSHTFGVFILAAQNLFLVLQLKKYGGMIKDWLVCQILILIAFLPNIYLIVRIDKIGTAGGWGWGLFSPSLLSLLRLAFHYVFTPRGARTWDIMLANYAGAGALLVAGTWVYITRQGKVKWITNMRKWGINIREEPNAISNILLVSCWLLLPILIPFIISLVILPIFADRYTISASPALYLLIAFGIFSVRKFIPLIISISVLVIMIVPSLSYYFVTSVDEQWKEVARYVEENSVSDETIVLASGLGIEGQLKVFEWYYHGAEKICPLSSEFTDSVAISTALARCTSGHQSFWVIVPDYPSDPSIHRYLSFFLGRDQTALRLIEEQHFVKLSLYLFEFTK